MLNLMDVDNLVETFLKEREISIATLHRVHFKNDNQLSLRALREELKEELRTGCVTFINKDSPMEELNDYLFYIANAYCKKIALPPVKHIIEYICPGCVYLGKDYSVIPFDKMFKCHECKSELKANELDPQKALFYKTFACHNKSGYRCNGCERFIPQPLDNSSAILCPYFDCFFAGQVTDLHKMHHPTSKTNPEKLILDAPQEHGSSLKDKLSSSDDALSQLEFSEDLQDKVNLLQDIIESQHNSVAYGSSDATVKQKQCVYQAISNLLMKFPIEMSAYLLNDTDNHMGFQHKIFQEFIRLLEGSLPFVITKNKELFKIDHLLSEELSLFDGKSVFDSIVNDKLIIKNETKEFYIGGRKAAYTKPYYIGKLLSVIHRDTKVPLMKNVKDYSFSRIRMQGIKVGTPVTVEHFRVPPHYQMGGMVYVNRIRKKIVERAKVSIS